VRGERGVAKRIEPAGACIGFDFPLRRVILREPGPEARQLVRCERGDVLGELFELRHAGEIAGRWLGKKEVG